MCSSHFNVHVNLVVCSVHIDAEISKCILQDMMEEAGVKTYLHSWSTEPVMDSNKAKGVIFESKSGMTGGTGKGHNRFHRLRFYIS